ncbi:MAG TPA: ASPIC/UnbV domain-containing protein, partial [Terriglobia bacterium]|nr:ASPIC/UnbV domain-containing protein [Terriglobia bacterium]
NWVKIKLVGTKCNRTAIGTRVKVTVGKHTQMDEVHTGYSVMSQSDLRLHFGLGQAKTVDVIEVIWPTLLDPPKSGGARSKAQAGAAVMERFTNIEANQILTIKEGSGIIKAEKIKT